MRRKPSSERAKGLARRPADNSTASAPTSNSSRLSGHAAPAHGTMGERGWQFWAAAVSLIGVFCWSYWPVLGELVKAWDKEPDYSHGYLVAPIAGYFLWRRRESFPGWDSPFAWGGAVLLGLSAAVRVAGSLWYIDSVQAWSIPLWAAGACLLLGGWRLLRWSLPAVAFLLFMIPIPFRAERLLSHPLQGVATRLSCWMLQILGQPAISEGNVVVINDVRLNVVEACSGLRIFMSIVALTFAYLVLIRRPWWTRLGLVLSILPVSLLVNASRIALTGLLYVYVSGPAAQKFSHDLAGWLMLPVATGLLALAVWYMDKLIIQAETVSTREALLGAVQPASGE